MSQQHPLGLDLQTLQPMCGRVMATSPYLVLTSTLRSPFMTLQSLEILFSTSQSTVMPDHTFSQVDLGAFNLAVTRLQTLILNQAIPTCPVEVQGPLNLFLDTRMIQYPEQKL